jgi:photosystem II stability/assembly factor-like uncharacterized protein
MLTGILSLAVLLVACMNKNAVGPALPTITLQGPLSLQNGVYQLAEYPNGDILASSYLGLYRSTDNGISWSFIQSPENRGLITVTTDGTIFMPFYLANSTDTISRIYRSTNEGYSWETVGLPWALSFGSTPDGGILASDLQGLYKSMDRGATWALVDTDSVMSYFSSFTSSYGRVYSVSLKNGVYISFDNGITWKPDGLSGAHAQWITHNHESLISDVGVEIYRNSGLDTSWLSAAAKDSALNYAGFWGLPVFDSQWDMFSIPGSYITDWGNNAALYSKDGGATWEKINVQFPNELSQITSLAVTRNDYLLAIIDGKIYRSVAPTTGP